MAMHSQEWSRSRYWHIQFLHSRHQRTPIGWPEHPAARRPSGDPATRWLRALATRQNDATWLIRQAVNCFPGDPAYVQSLRLVMRERQHHHQLIDRLLGPPTEPPPRCDLFLQAGEVLGVRYTLSALLLADLIDLTLLRLVHDRWCDPVQRSVCQAIIAEKRVHMTFHCERLTMAFAEFNFARRNLRRLRLRLMFVAKLGRVLAEHRGLLGRLGIGWHDFVFPCWSSFTELLETMVPYRRERLLRTLLNQREQPYAKANPIEPHWPTGS